MKTVAAKISVKNDTSRAKYNLVLLQLVSIAVLVAINLS